MKSDTPLTGIFLSAATMNSGDIHLGDINSGAGGYLKASSISVVFWKVP